MTNTKYQVTEWRNAGGTNSHWWTGPAAGVLRILPEESVDAIVTAAPGYWTGPNAGSGGIGKEDTPEQYVWRLGRILEEAQRVLRATGTLWISVPDTTYCGRGRGNSKGVPRVVDKAGGLGANIQPKTLLGLPWAVARHASRNGWRIRSEITWIRGRNGTGPATTENPRRDRPKRQSEKVFLLSKSRHYRYADQVFRNDPATDVWLVPGGRAGDSMPALVAERCLLLAGISAGDRVLDPLAGNGTALVAAAGRYAECWGIDPRSETVERARARLTEPEQPRLNEDELNGCRTSADEEAAAGVKRIALQRTTGAREGWRAPA